MVSPISLVSFLITLLLASAISIQGVQINDTDGNPVKVDEQYFIQPVKTESNNGGGLVPAAITTLPFCPLGITQILLLYQPGLPISFSFIGPDSKQTIVDTYSDVNIEFKSNIWPVCNEFSKYLGVDVSSSASKEPAIIIGAEPIRTNSWFQIRTAGKDIYELATRSGTVGTIPGAWLRAPQLVLTNDTAKTLFVKLKKVEDATLATY